MCLFVLFFINGTHSRNTHSNLVIYRCEFCQKGFYRILAYEKHRATHTGVAAAVPCAQPDCSFTYSDMTQLKDHMAVCHPGKIYTCGTCSKVFLTKQNLVNHQVYPQLFSLSGARAFPYRKWAFSAH